MMVSLVTVAVKCSDVESKACPCARASWAMVHVLLDVLAAFPSALRPAHARAVQNEHHSAEWLMQLRSHRAAVLRSSCSQYAVGLLVNAGEFRCSSISHPYVGDACSAE